MWIIKEKVEGGFGANVCCGDLIYQRPIHYAIAFKHEEVFQVLLDHMQRSESSDAMIKINCSSIPYTLANFCIVKQSWRCFAYCLERFGLTHLHTTVLTLEGFDEETKNKTAR